MRRRRDFPYGDCQKRCFCPTSHLAYPLRRSQHILSPSKCGGGEIRTRECLRTHTFQACGMGHYPTPPLFYLISTKRPTIGWAFSNTCLSALKVNFSKTLSLSIHWTSSISKSCFAISPSRYSIT